MAILKNFVYCLGTKTETLNDGERPVTNIIGLANSLSPDFIPGNFSFSIVFSILDLDSNSKYKVDIAFVDETGKELIRTESTTFDGDTTEQNVYNVPNEFFGYNIAAELRNVVLEKEGKYKTVIYLNEQNIGEYPIYVKGKKRGSR